MKKRVIIDTDPGIDDALALALAIKSSELMIKAITIVAGNVVAEQGARNALRVFDAFAGNLPLVYKGAEQPLKKALRTSLFHGEDGLGDCGWPISSRQYENQSAVDVMIELPKKYPNEITLICLGPLTNLALALKKDCEAIAKYKEVFIMGGAVEVPGNITPNAEFNFWVDPEAASFVLNHIENTTTIFGLDVTRKVLLTPDAWKVFEERSEPVAELIVRMLRRFPQGLFINDPLVILASIFPGLLEYVECKKKLDVVLDGQNRGKLIFGEPANSSIKIAYKVKAKQAIDLFLERIN